MTKVLYIQDNVREGTVYFGEAELGLVDGSNIRVNGKLVHASAVWKDTIHNRELISQFRRQYKAWIARRPNIMDFLEQMERIGDARNTNAQTKNSA